MVDNTNQLEHPKSSCLDIMLVLSFKNQYYYKTNKKSSIEKTTKINKPANIAP